MFLFYRRDQHTDEAVADCVTALRKLAEDCGFVDKRLPLDIMMRDRFLGGLMYETVQRRIFAEHNFKFDLAYDVAVTAKATS